MSEKPKPPLPKGCVYSTSPGGDVIVVRAPRGPGPWYRVMHPAFGFHEVRVAESKGTKDKDFDPHLEAVRLFAEHFSPGEAQNAEWVKRLRMECRVSKLPEPKPEAA